MLTRLVLQLETPSLVPSSKLRRKEHLDLLSDVDNQVFCEKGTKRNCPFQYIYIYIYIYSVRLLDKPCVSALDAVWYVEKNDWII